MLTASARACPAAARLTRACTRKSRFSAGCPSAKRPRLERAVVAATEQADRSLSSQQLPPQLEVAAPATGLDSVPPAATAAATAGAPVLVAFKVPRCRLAFGEQLRVVGAAPELGGWDPAAAPALEWGEGDAWAGRVALLAPGQFEFKLVVQRSDGSAAWEEGPNRCLALPELTARSPSSGAALLSVQCGWGDTAATAVQADQAQLEAAAAAAAARVAELLHRKQALAAQLEALEREVEDSGAKIAGIEADMQQLVRSEAARAAEEQAQQAAAATAAAAAETPAAAAAQQAAGAVRSGSAANAVVPAASMRVGRDGSLAFHFDTTAAGSQASALELARQRLAAQLPREAAASLERSLHRQQAASGMRYRRRRAELAETERQLVGAGAGAVEAAAGGGGPGGAHGTAATAVRHALAARVDTLRREVASEALQASRLAEDLEGLLSLHTSGHGGASLSSGSSAAAGAGAAAGRHAFASTGAVPQAARPATPDPVLRGSFAGIAICLAAYSAYAAGSMLWGLARTVVPAAGRRAADAAVGLAVAGAAAVLLS